MNKWALALWLTGIGWYIGLCIVLGAVAGLWLDSKFDTGPWLTFGGLTFGFLLALFGAYRMIRRAMKGM